MIRVLGTSYKIGGPKTAIFKSERKLRRNFVYHFAGKRPVTQAPISQSDARQITVFGVIDAERAINTEPILQNRRGEPELYPAAASADSPDAAGSRSNALDEGKIGIVTLKNAALKTAEVPAEKRFAGQAEAVGKR